MAHSRAHLWVAGSSWASRVVTGGVSLLNLRLLLEQLSAPQFAALALLQGLAGWFLLADGGIANSTHNRIASASTDDGKVGSRHLYEPLGRRWPLFGGPGHLLARSAMGGSKLSRFPGTSL